MSRVFFFDPQQQRARGPTKKGGGKFMKLFLIEGVFLVPLMRLKIGGIFGTVIPLFRKE